MPGLFFWSHMDEITTQKFKCPNCYVCWYDVCLKSTSTSGYKEMACEFCVKDGSIDHVVRLERMLSVIEDCEVQDWPVLFRLMYVVLRNKKPGR